jgi:hypothetical protein
MLPAATNIKLRPVETHEDNGQMSDEERAEEG